MDEVERIEATVALKGMELRMVEVLRTEIDKILRIKSGTLSINTLDAELFNIEPDRRASF